MYRYRSVPNGRQIAYRALVVDLVVCWRRRWSGVVCNGATWTKGKLCVATGIRHLRSRCFSTGICLANSRLACIVDWYRCILLVHQASNYAGNRNSVSVRTCVMPILLAFRRWRLWQDLSYFLRREVVLQST